MIHRQTTVECTINLHKRLHGVKFKNRAARAVFEIKKLNKTKVKIISDLTSF